MKIRVEIDPEMFEEEVIIRCRELDENISQIQRAIADVTNRKQRFAFYKGEKEF